MYVSTCPYNDTTGNGEFKRQRRLLQRKRQIEIELCVNLSVFRLFHVGHVVQNRRSALSFAWHEMGPMHRMKDLLLRARGVVRTSNIKISPRPLTGYVEKTAPKSVLHVPHASDLSFFCFFCLFFFFSFNQSSY